MQADNEKEPILPLAFNPKINWNIFWRIFLLPLAVPLILLLLFLLYAYFIDRSGFGWDYFGEELSMLMLAFSLAFSLYVPPAALTALLAAKIAFKPGLSSGFALVLLATGLHIGWGLLYLKEFIVFYSLVPLFYAATAWRVFNMRYEHYKAKWLKQQKLPTHADKALEYVEKVIALVRQRIIEHPEHGAYRSMLPQLNYIKTVLSKPATDRSELHRIDFCTGGPAGELFEREDPELYDVIGGVLWIASQIGRGLKMDGQVLEQFIKEFPSSAIKS